MTLHASRLTSTKIYAGEAMFGGRYVHVLGYQNDASSQAPGPNAMVLPIPSRSEMGVENAFDTRQYDGFLGDIAESTKELSLSERGFGDTRSKSMPKVFDVGSYTVVLGTSMEDAIRSVSQVPGDKRPVMNGEVLMALGGLYPGWSFAICCWKGSIKAEPLLWWYEPKAPAVLFAPSVDAHDGRGPREGTVSVDAVVTFGSTLRPTGVLPIRYRKVLSAEAKELLPTYAVGQHVRESHANGDFWYPVTGLDGHTGYEDSGWAPLPASRVFPGVGKPKTAIALNQW